MAALDTNVLVRLLVKDDENQLAAARNLIRQRVASGEALFIPVTVFLELEWVLRSRFLVKKSPMLSLLNQLLAARELVFESESALEIALSLYGSSTADYSDCLHIALANQAGERPLWTFDRTAAKVDGAQCLAT